MMSRLSLLAAGALALALAAPAYSQSGAAPGGDTSKPAQTERSSPSSDRPGAAGTDRSATPERGASGSSGMGSGASGQSAATTQQGSFITQQAASQKSAERLIGMSVKSTNDEDIGEVTDLILDDQNRVIGAVVSVGGFLGIGEKNVGVSWNEMQIREDGDQPVATVNLTKDQLTNAPEFKTQEAERRPATTGRGGTTGTPGTGGTNR